jgi:hypothetical protein
LHGSKLPLINGQPENLRLQRKKQYQPSNLGGKSNIKIHQYTNFLREHSDGIIEFMSNNQSMQKLNIKLPNLPLPYQHRMIKRKKKNEDLDPLLKSPLSKNAMDGLGEWNESR